MGVIKLIREKKRLIIVFSSTWLSIYIKGKRKLMFLSIYLNAKQKKTILCLFFLVYQYFKTINLLFFDIFLNLKKTYYGFHSSLHIT